MTNTPGATDTKSFRGSFLVWRKKGQRLHTKLTTDGEAAVASRRYSPPRFRHPDFSSAEAEAQRLASMCPGTTFVIIQEIARVKAAAPGQVVE